MQIPSGVRGLLWEHQFDGDVIDRPCEDTVLERVMQRGGWSEMQWLLRTFDRGRLRHFLAHRGRRVLAPRALRFWSFACGVPGHEQDAWVAEARDRERAWRG